jgi:hypothetical protein
MQYLEIRVRGTMENAHLKAIYYVPKLHDCHCDKTDRFNGLYGSCIIWRGIRTEKLWTIGNHTGGKLGKVGLRVGNCDPDIWRYCASFFRAAR